MRSDVIADNVVAAIPEEVKEQVLGAEFARRYMGHVRLVTFPC